MDQTTEKQNICQKSLTVEFYMIKDENGIETANVMIPEEKPVQGSKYAAHKR